MNNDARSIRRTGRNMLVLLYIGVPALILVLALLGITWRLNATYPADQPGTATAIAACQEFALRKIQTPRERIRFRPDTSPRRQERLKNTQYWILDVAEVLHNQGIIEYRMYTCTTSWSDGTYTLNTFRFMTQ